MCRVWAVARIATRSRKRASQVSLTHPEGAYAIIQALIAQGVVGDYREPGVLRFGFAPLYLRYTDVWDAVMQLKSVLQSEAWRSDAFSAKQTVT